MSELRTDDTIAALASAAGAGGRGIVRVSGPATLAVLGRLFVAGEGANWQKSRRAGRYTGAIRLGDAKPELPAAVYLWPTRRSYTGEAMAELHTIGAPPLLEAALSALYDEGVRPARPGEFTLRAFLAGRIDLVQAEAVLGVVDAHSHRELETALTQLAGGISGKLAVLRGELLNLLADLEAGLDFVEEDIEFVSAEEMAARLGEGITTLEALAAQADVRMQSTGRLRVVLAGLPNAGKSTLFNALAGREAALVSEVEGTTRDYLHAMLDWKHVAVELVDTAGWETLPNDMMAVAQTLRGEQVERADLILWCRSSNLDPAARTADAALLETLVQQKRPVLVVVTKGELSGGDAGNADVRVSAHEGAGLDELVEAAAERLSAGTGGSREFVGSTAARCRESLVGAARALERAREAAAFGAGDELIAIEVRDALEHLGSILGTVYTDDILDRIFSKFCIGK